MQKNIAHKNIAMYIQHSMSVHTYILTEGMANASDATDVNALALSKSDTKPAKILPAVI